MNRGPEITIIGAGAAGCFCGALLGADASLKRSGARITIYEAGRKPLAKVAITGGGRCNLTNSFKDTTVEKAYPRGARMIGRLMAGFSNEDTCGWFTSRGVALVTQEDQCVFPKSQNAMQIVDTLLGSLREGGVRIVTESPAKRIEPSAEGYIIHFDGKPSVRAAVVLVAIGGLATAKMQELFQGLDLEIEKPVPSLFTLKTDSAVRELAGTVVNPAQASLQGTKLSAVGPLLITDWGFSGPAILKLSSYGARTLSETGYKGTLAINWMYGSSEEELRGWLQKAASANPEKQVASVHPERLTSRLWNFILNKASIRENIKFAELSPKMAGRLCSTILCDCYPVTGRARFKEEFVTCGGVALGQLNQATLECKRYPGLYFAGEVMDVDAVTGGFNLQAAWTTGYTVAKSIVKSIQKD